MKKLVMLLAAAVATFVASAAQLDWRYNATSADVGKTVYVLLGDTAQTSWDSVDALSAASVSSGVVAKSGRSSYLTTGSFSSDAISKTSANVYYVVVSADASTFDVTSVANMAGSVYGEQDSSPGSNTALSSASITSSGNTFGGTPTPPGPTPGDVPEPTSGLLLLVGGAMLALRRKQK